MSAPPKKKSIRLEVNGEWYQADVEPRLLLVYFLREVAGLTGTHVGCVVGECGACSVLVDGQLVKSCLMLAVQANGASVRTVESLARDGELSALQESFVEHYALQCGYCTPGFLMASHYLLSRRPSPTEEDIRRDLSSNLCMCTGYTQIVEAVKAAAAKRKAGGE